VIGRCEESQLGLSALGITLQEQENKSGDPDAHGSELYLFYI
jgi:hypothetical protein